MAGEFLRIVSLPFLCSNVVNFYSTLLNGRSYPISLQTSREMKEKFEAADPKQPNYVMGTKPISKNSPSSLITTVKPLSLFLQVSLNSDGISFSYGISLSEY